MYGWVYHLCAGNCAEVPRLGKRVRSSVLVIRFLGEPTLRGDVRRVSDYSCSSNQSCIRKTVVALVIQGGLRALRITQDHMIK